MRKARESLPSIAPKASIDIKHIRQNPELYSRNCVEHNYKEQKDHPFKIVRLFDQWRQSQINTRSLREKSNAIQKQLSPSRISSSNDPEGQDAPTKSKNSLLEEARTLKDELSATSTLEASLISEIDILAVSFPNLTSPETPIDSPKILNYINSNVKPPPSSHPPRDHIHIGTALSLLDFTSASTTTGWGFYYLHNSAALLEQALINYALSVAIKHGFTPVTPPSIVYSHIASACGFRPRDQNGEQQIYAIQGKEREQGRDRPGLCLAGTAEIPFAGMNANRVLEGEGLPRKVVGPSRCSRAEAGARGTDTEGLYRVHEFTKVEMFAWTLPSPDAANEIFNTMLAIKMEIVSCLGLHCRILKMPASDFGASAARKQDIEVHFPSRTNIDEGWGEVTSTSICTDYQTRRLETRVKGVDGKLGFPYTVNGTAVAVPRVLAALLEYGIEEGEGDLRVRLREVLWPWMHGVRVIEKKSLQGK